MKNKELIKKLRDNAELAMAAYGYFHYFLEKQSKSYFIVLQDEKGNEIRDINNQLKTKEIYITDILNTKYKNHTVVEFVRLGNKQKEITIGTLNGDFTPTQAKRFFERYDLLIHQPNTDSGFSATLFGEKRKQTNKETKEVSYTAEYGYINYILAIRGTEPSNMGDIKADVNLTFKNLPKKQYEDMILFYYQCIGKIPFYVELDSIPKDKNSQDYKLWQKLYQRSKDSKYKPYINPLLLKDSTKPPFIESSLESNIETNLKSNTESNKTNTETNFTPPIDSKTKLTITGHSLGGCLTQLFALSFANTKSSGIINEVYTFNSPGAKNLQAPCFSQYLKIQSLEETSYKQTLDSLIKFLYKHNKSNNPSDNYYSRLSTCCNDFLMAFYESNNPFGCIIPYISHTNSTLNHSITSPTPSHPLGQSKIFPAISRLTSFSI